MSYKRVFARFLLLLSAILLFDSFAHGMPRETAISLSRKKGRETGLPIPRFVSLKAKQARMRVGPAFEYAVKWLYQAPGFPLEITEEYGNWRQVRDCDGVSGWMHQSLLSSNRTAIIGPWLTDMAALRVQPVGSGSIEANLEPRVKVRILSCSLSWCDVALDSDHLTGFVEKTSLWGVYPMEVFR